jgi:hypothetical protein
MLTFPLATTPTLYELQWMYHEALDGRFAVSGTPLDSESARGFFVSSEKRQEF